MFRTHVRATSRLGRRQFALGPESVKTVAAAIGVYQNGLPLLTKATQAVNHVAKAFFLHDINNSELLKAWSKLNSRFVVSFSVQEKMWGPLLPRPEFVADIDARLLRRTKGVMYVGPSNLGKTVAVLSRLANAGNEEQAVSARDKEGENKNSGIPGVIHLSMREIQDENVFSTFAKAVGLDPSKGSIDLQSDFTELLKHFHDIYKRPAILVLEDLHCESLCRRIEGGLPRLTPNAAQMMGMLVNLEGVVFPIITASDPIAVQLLRNVSGATARFDIVNFPPTADEHLINFLQTIVVDEAKEVSVVVGSSVASDGQLENIMAKLKTGESKIVFTEEDGRFFVRHLGSHCGDLVAALQFVVNGTSPKEAVDMVIAGYTEALSAAICSPQAGTYFTLDQFTLAAFKTFETLSTNHLEPVRYSTILNPDEKKAVPPHALRTALDKMVELNLVTFPSASDPGLVQFACRAHYHAWLDVCEEAEVQEALTTARVNLASKYDLQEVPLADDLFAQLADAVQIEEVVRMVAKQRGYTEERWQNHAKLLAEKEIDTVGDLRVLTNGDIEKLGLPPVVTRYLLRVKAGGEK